VVTSTIPVVERIIPPGIVYSVVYAGVADRTHKDHAEVLKLLEQAMDVELDGLPYPKRKSATRHARRAADEILRPYVERRESAAKFGLSAFYALRELIDEGHYVLDEDGPFAEAMEAVLNPEGTVTELANVDGIDRSAQKHARRIIEKLRSMGYYKRG
jgi:hypothetical protein